MENKGKKKDSGKVGAILALVILILISIPLVSCIANGIDSGSGARPRPSSPSLEPTIPESTESDTTVNEDPIVWDISATENDNVIATYSPKLQTLSIEGTGNMLDWSSGGGAPWYSYRDEISYVEIGNGVSKIGKFAFNSCYKLTSIVIPDSVTLINDQAFGYCSGLTSVVFGEDSQLRILSRNAFYGCARIMYNEYDNAYYLGNENNPFVVLVDAKYTDITSCEIHSNAKIIGSFAFYGQNSGNDNLESIVIPDGVRTICSNAFYDCGGLRSVIFGENSQLMYIGGSAFKICNYLTSIAIPNSVTSIGSYAFSSCTRLSNRQLPNSLTSIGSYAFENCNKFTSIEIPDSVTDIGAGAFAGCDSLTSINVSENNATYTSIDGNLYNKDATVLISYATGKTDVSFDIPDSVTSIYDRAFDQCDNIMSIEIPNSVTSIGTYAFHNCEKLTSVKFPDSLTSISGYMFASCFDLTSVVIPNSVTCIEGYAFSTCNSLTDVYYTGTEEEWASITIDSNNKYLAEATIHYNSET